MQGDNGGAEGPPTPIKSAAKGAPKMAWHPYQTGPDHLEASTYEPLLPITSIFPGMIDSSWTPRSARSFSSTWGLHSVGSIDSSWIHRSARSICSTRGPHSVGSIESSWMPRSARSFSSTRGPHSVGSIESSWMPRSARSFCSTWGPHSVGSIESSWMPRSARYFFSTRDPHSEASINSSWIHRFARHCYCKRKSLPVSLSHLPDKQFIPCYFSEEYVHSNIPFDSEDSMVSEP
jgi:hypothetical protein